MMPLKHTRDISDTYGIPMTIKDSSCQCLSQGIHQVIHIRYLLNHYITSLNYLTNQVVLPLNVFNISVVSWLFKLYQNSTIVTKQYHGLYNQGNDLKFHKELLKPNNFLCCLKSYNVFNIHSGVNNAR